MFTYTSKEIAEISSAWNMGDRGLAMVRAKSRILGYLQLAGVPQKIAQAALTRVEGAGADTDISLSRFLKVTREIAEVTEQACRAGQL